MQASCFVNIGPSLAMEVEKNGPTTERSEVGDSDGGPDTIFRFSEISVDQVLNN